MPIYCYRNPESGEIVEHFAEIGKAPEHIHKDAVKHERCLPAELAGQGGMRASTWPMTSQALAVHPTQRGEYMRFADAHGVPTEFDTRGRPVFRTKKHRRKYCELVGATDFDGGYGDPYSER